MQGTVVLWSDRGGYAFVQCDDGGKDVFVHVREVAAPGVERGQLRRLAEGDRLEFVVSEGPKGLQGTGARLLQSANPPRANREGDIEVGEMGTVVSWNERGFAFVKLDGDGPDVFVHVRDMAEHPRRGKIRQLWKGERVELMVENGPKGLTAAVGARLVD